MRSFFYKKILLSIFTSIICSTSFYSFAKNKGFKSTFKITNIKGSVVIKRNNKLIKAKNNLEILESDIISSDSKSRAEIEVNIKSKIRINSNTEITFSEKKKKKEKITFLKVLKGQVWANIFNNKKDKFVIKSDKSAMAVLGTVFDVSSEPEKTEMRVFDGSVGITTNDENTTNLENKIDKLNLKVDSQRNSLKPKQIEKPVSVIQGPHQVSIDEWLEIVENYKITIDSEGNSIVSDMSKEDLSKEEWINWNKKLDKN